MSSLFSSSSASSCYPSSVPTVTYTLLNPTDAFAELRAPQSTLDRRRRRRGGGANAEDGNHSTTRSGAQLWNRDGTPMAALSSAVPLPAERPPPSRGTAQQQQQRRGEDGQQPADDDDDDGGDDGDDAEQWCPQPYPGPRSGHSMLYSPLLGASVLYGGMGYDESHDDVWTVTVRRRVDGGTAVRGDAEDAATVEEAVDTLSDGVEQIRIQREGTVEEGGNRSDTVVGKATVRAHSGASAAASPAIISDVYDTPALDGAARTGQWEVVFEQWDGAAGCGHAPNHGTSIRLGRANNGVASHADSDVGGEGEGLGDDDIGGVIPAPPRQSLPNTTNQTTTNNSNPNNNNHNNNNNRRPACFGHAACLFDGGAKMFLHGGIDESLIDAPCYLDLVTRKWHALRIVAAEPTTPPATTMRGAAAATAAAMTTRNHNNNTTAASTGKAHGTSSYSGSGSDAQQRRCACYDGGAARRYYRRRGGNQQQQQQEGGGGANPPLTAMDDINVGVSSDSDLAEERDGGEDDNANDNAGRGEEGGGVGSSSPSASLPSIPLATTDADGGPPTVVNRPIGGRWGHTASLVKVPRSVAVNNGWENADADADAGGGDDEGCCSSTLGKRSAGLLLEFIVIFAGDATTTDSSADTFVINPRTWRSYFISQRMSGFILTDYYLFPQMHDVDPYSPRAQRALRMLKLKRVMPRTTAPNRREEGGAVVASVNALVEGSAVGGTAEKRLRSEMQHGVGANSSGPSTDDNVDGDGSSGPSDGDADGDAAFISAIRAALRPVGMAYPFPRRRHCAAVDEGHRYVVIFGGRSIPSDTFRGDTWVFDSYTCLWTPLEDHVTPRELAAALSAASALGCVGCGCGASRTMPAAPTASYSADSSHSSSPSSSMAVGGKTSRSDGGGCHVDPSLPNPYLNMASCDGLSCISSSSPLILRNYAADRSLRKRLSFSVRNPRCPTLVGASSIAVMGGGNTIDDVNSPYYSRRYLPSAFGGGVSNTLTALHTEREEQLAASAVAVAHGGSAVNDNGATAVGGGGGGGRANAAPNASSSRRSPSSSSAGVSKSLTEVSAPPERRTGCCAAFIGDWYCVQGGFSSSERFRQGRRMVQVVKSYNEMKGFNFGASRRGAASSSSSSSSSVSVLAGGLSPYFTIKGQGSLEAVDYKDLYKNPPAMTMSAMCVVGKPPLHCYGAGRGGGNGNTNSTNNNKECQLYSANTSSRYVLLYGGRIGDTPTATCYLMEVSHRREVLGMGGDGDGGDGGHHRGLHGLAPIPHKSILDDLRREHLVISLRESAAAAGRGGRRGTAGGGGGPSTEGNTANAPASSAAAAAVPSTAVGYAEVTVRPSTSSPFANNSSSLSSSHNNRMRSITAAALADAVSPSHAAAIEAIMALAATVPYGPPHSNSMDRRSVDDDHDGAAAAVMMNNNSYVGKSIRSSWSKTALRCGGAPLVGTHDTTDSLSRQCLGWFTAHVPLRDAGRRQAILDCVSYWVARGRDERSPPTAPTAAAVSPTHSPAAVVLPNAALSNFSMVYRHNTHRNNTANNHNHRHRVLDAAIADCRFVECPALAEEGGGGVDALCSAEEEEKGNGALGVYRRHLRQLPLRVYEDPFVSPRLVHVLPSTATATTGTSQCIINTSSASAAPPSASAAPPLAAIAGRPIAAAAASRSPSRRAGDGGDPFTEDTVPAIVPPPPPTNTTASAGGDGSDDFDDGIDDGFEEEEDDEGDFYSDFSDDGEW